MKVGIISLIFIITSCANKLLKQAPKLAPAETFYKIEEKKYQVSHNRCKKLNGDVGKRKCTKTYFDVGELWNLFYPNHIIIKKDTVFR